ncbi:MAG: (deoxy)nucleoside triphosphate pyrophosphohydrolase [Cytophagaceae bacterium]|jgi:8-oxo-dGTP diphosphatase|nr:(deoxy)nucleoside triphosphate pyrophosphohydrolase [Cytophagaceae bacterium]
MLIVCCALIVKQGCVLAVQRSQQMTHAGLWEFPGGKAEPDESLKDCIVREIQEELGMNFSVEQTLEPVAFQYPERSILLHPFVGTSDDTPALSEHQAFQWLAPGDLPSMDWLAADIPVWQQWLRIENSLK